MPGQISRGGLPQMSFLDVWDEENPETEVDR
jgi:hypothetical protein